jgi:hypothetical protein
MRNTTRIVAALLFAIGTLGASTVSAQSDSEEIESQDQVIAHGGGLDRKGCHTNRKTGEYHCH